MEELNKEFVKRKDAFNTICEGIQADVQKLNDDNEVKVKAIFKSFMDVVAEKDMENQKLHDAIRDLTDKYNAEYAKKNDIDLKKRFDMLRQIVIQKDATITMLQDQIRTFEQNCMYTQIAANEDTDQGTEVTEGNADYDVNIWGRPSTSATTVKKENDGLQQFPAFD